ncbi:hypothetical protein [Stieleria sp.]|uniref:hypothetical protein n=1 Tax=Stieleria sp. TaxID=2795976 RepID=UPI0035650D29
MGIREQIRRPLHRIRPCVGAATVWIGLLSILLLFGFVNLYWRARPGSEEFASSLHTLSLSTIGVGVDMRTPAESYPDRQYEFWQEAVDRILEAHPDDAGLYAAAALIFHEPCVLYTSDVAKDVADEDVHAVLFPGEVIDRIRESRSDFDRQGSARSSELIRRATELDPDDRRWWRLRAVLLWPSPMTSQESIPRDSNWEQVLHDAEHHDPENGLYTVLHAYGHSQTAIGLDEDANTIIADSESWSRTIGLAKKCVTYRTLTLGEPGVSDMVRLHSLSRHPRATTTESIRHRLIGWRNAYFTIGLARQLMRMADAKEIEAEYEKREDLLRLAQAIIDLAHQRSDKLTRYQTITYQMRRILLEVRSDLERERGQVSKLTASELKDATRWEAVVKRAAASVNQSQPTPAGAVVRAASMIALSLFASTLGTTIVLTVLWILFGRPSPNTRGILWLFALYFLGVGLSVLFLGAGPAGLVSESVQHWILTGVSFVLLWLLMGGIAARLAIRVQFSIRSLLIGTGVVALLLQMVVHFQLGWDAFGLPIHVHASSDRLIGMIEQHQPNSSDHWLPGPSWVSPLILQWVMHKGPSWSVAVFLVLIAIRLVWSFNFAQSVGQLLIAVSLLTLLWLNVWVWIEPANYVTARHAQIRLETYIRSVEEYYEPIEEFIGSELAVERQETG